MSTVTALMGITVHGHGHGLPGWIWTSASVIKAGALVALFVVLARDRRSKRKTAKASVVLELIAEAKRLGVDSTALEGDVHEAASASASAINVGGRAHQIAYLVGRRGEQHVRDRLAEIAAEQR